MRLFLTLCSLAVVTTYAKPQYNYASGISGTIAFRSNNQEGGGGGSGGAGFIDSGADINSGGGGGGGIAGIIGAGSNNGVVSSGGFQQNGYNYNGYSQNGGFSSLSNSQFSSGSQQNFRGNPNQNIQSSNEENLGFGEPIVHKQIFTFTTPEDKDNVQKTKRLLIGRPQTNYRVVFIKAPSSSSSNVKLAAEYAPKEEKTVIYVLTKKESELNINEIATPPPTQPSKPEVHFIKYKTDQEAEFAQSQITSEYDKIRGSSEKINAGDVQEKDFIGVLESNETDLSQVSTSTIDGNSGNINGDIEGSGSTTNTNNVYLPPSGGNARKIYKIRI